MDKEAYSRDNYHIDPRTVPSRPLRTGDRIPAIGLGTFGSDHVSGEEVAQAVEVAVGMGYRHLDCAAVYGNEHLIGERLQAMWRGGLAREEMWITSKLWNDKHAPEDVIPACRASLRQLQLERLDLYLVHWPFPHWHPPGCDVSSRSPDSRPYVHGEFMATWREMERLVELGLVRNIGVSNMTVAKLELLLRDAALPPVVNEMELHPHFQQPELFHYCVQHGVVPVGYCPVGSPARPKRDRTAEDTVDIEDPVVVEIANRHGIHPAVLCIKWAEQRGQIPIPMSTNPRHLYENLRCVTTPRLSDDDMARLAAVDRNCRLIKGQVFLWEEATGWEDLWDLDGVIAGWAETSP